MGEQILTVSCGMSWDGFNIQGDCKSIKEVKRLKHRSDQLEEHIHNAILATREECAKVADRERRMSRRAMLQAERGEEPDEKTCWLWSCQTAESIAAAIRALGSEKVEGGS